MRTRVYIAVDDSYCACLCANLAIVVPAINRVMNCGKCKVLRSKIERSETLEARTRDPLYPFRKHSFRKMPPGEGLTDNVNKSIFNMKVHVERKNSED